MKMNGGQRVRDEEAKTQRDMGEKNATLVTHDCEEKDWSVKIIQEQLVEHIYGV